MQDRLVVVFIDWDDGPRFGYTWARGLPLAGEFRPPQDTLWEIATPSPPCAEHPLRIWPASMTGGGGPGQGNDAWPTSGCGVGGPRGIYHDHAFAPAPAQLRCGGSVVPSRLASYAVFLLSFGGACFRCGRRRDTMLGTKSHIYHNARRDRPTASPQAVSGGGAGAGAPGGRQGRHGLLVPAPHPPAFGRLIPSEHPGPRPAPPPCLRPRRRESVCVSWRRRGGAARLGSALTTAPLEAAVAGRRSRLARGLARRGRPAACWSVQHSPPAPRAGSRPARRRRHTFGTAAHAGANQSAAPSAWTPSG